MGDKIVSISNNRGYTALFFIFYSLLAFVLWRNRRALSGAADSKEGELARDLRSLSSWNGIFLIFILILWLFLLFQLAGFVGYSFQAWKRHPKWASSASSLLEEEGYGSSDNQVTRKRTRRESREPLVRQDILSYDD